MAWSILYNNANVSSQTLAYTVPAGSEGRLSASFANRSTSATATATLWVVPSGETVGNEHLKESGTNLGLAGTSQATLERFFVAPAGTKVYVQAGNSNVSCQVQGDIVLTSVASLITTNGASSISYGTNWFYGSGQLKRIGDLCVCNITVGAAGAVSSPQFTLPASFRPSNSIEAVGIYYDFSAGAYFPAYVSITTAGVVSVTGYNGSSAISYASGDIASVTTTFLTA